MKSSFQSTLRLCSKSILQQGIFFYFLFFDQVEDSNVEKITISNVLIAAQWVYAEKWCAAARANKVAAMLRKFCGSIKHI